MNKSNSTMGRRDFLKSGAALGALASVGPVRSVAQTSSSSTKATGTAVIYANGAILTMEGDKPDYVEAVVVRDGTIAFVGSRAEAMSSFKDATFVDLQGRTMLPGFIDLWGHFKLFAQQTLGVNISYFADRPPRNAADVIALLKAAKPFNGWIIGYGYSDAMLSDGSPTLEQLDAAFPDVPVMLSNLSTLTGKVNSAGLAKLGFTAQTAAPQPGVIVKDPKTGKLTGDLLFTPFLMAQAEAVGSYSQDTTFETFRAAEHLLVRQGYTTIQSYQLNLSDLSDLRLAYEKGVISLDVIGLPSVSDAATAKMVQAGDWRWGAYSHADRGVKVAGYQVSTDAAPQLRLAAMTQPYLDTTGFPEHWKGILLPQAVVDSSINYAYANGIQLFAYSNGDAGIDMCLKAIESAVAATGQAKDRRTIIAHSFFVRPDQLALYKAYDIGASMMPLHLMQYGDSLTQYLGPERADLESPAATSMKLGVRTTFHNDCPSASPNVLAMVGAAVTRTSLSGRVMGPGERVSPYQALLGVTREAAFTYREEATKGTISVGKIADLVVLGANPLDTAPENIKTIEVVRTIKRGETVFAA
ncbi:MAG: amidohydrolase family protein [Alsobacter sp.]